MLPKLLSKCLTFLKEIYRVLSRDVEAIKVKLKAD
jgi:hypothetical protein